MLGKSVASNFVGCFRGKILYIGTSIFQHFSSNSGGYYINMNYYTRMPTKHFQEVKREGLFTCPLICYKYSAILSDGQWIHQNFLVWKKKWTIKNHANQVSKKQNSKSIRKELPNYDILVTFWNISIIFLTMFSYTPIKFSF